MPSASRVAAELAVAEREAECARLERLRDRLEEAILAQDSRRDDSRPQRRASRAAHPERLRARHRQRVDAHGARPARHRLLRGLGVSVGSITPSHVLSAIGVEPDLASSAIRMSLGSLTTDACIDRVAEVYPALVNKARGAARTAD